MNTAEERKSSRQLKRINNGYVAIAIIIVGAMLFLLIKNTIDGTNLLSGVKEIVAAREEENREQEVRQQQALRSAFERIDELESNLQDQIERNDVLLERVARALEIPVEEIEDITGRPSAAGPEEDAPRKVNEPQASSSERPRQQVTPRPSPSPAPPRSSPAPPPPASTSPPAVPRRPSSPPASPPAAPSRPSPPNRPPLPAPAQPNPKPEHPRDRVNSSACAVGVCSSEAALGEFLGGSLLD